MRLLIVNADDFGRSDGINRGIIEAHGNGIVTSASLMVRWPSAQEAAEYARRHQGFSVGLHLDLQEWTFHDGEWTKLYEVVPVDEAAAVRDEVARQLDAFRELLGAAPTHLDSHQHIHHHEPVHTILRGCADDLGIPCRGFSSIYYCGDFYGQTSTGQPLPGTLSVQALTKVLSELPQGVTELACHPGLGVEIDTMYRDEREQEVVTLCDERVRAVLAEEKIALCSFKDCRNG
jgi:chitin disaccharide deacetylase